MSRQSPLQKSEKPSLSRSKKLSVDWIDVLVEVLIDIVVLVVKCLVAVVSVEVDSIGLGHVNGFEGTWNKGHELSKYADASVPESRLGEAAGGGPRSRTGVVDLDHIGQLEGVVVAAGHIESTAESCHAASDMNMCHGTNLVPFIFLWVVDINLSRVIPYEVDQAI